MSDQPALVHSYLDTDPTDADAAEHESIGRSWLILEVADMQIGIPARHVTEMVPLGKLTTIPGSPVAVRGVATVRDRILPAIDLRATLGLADRSDEVGGVVEELTVRKRDHIEWLEELKASVEENRRFEKTTDPHACAFGVWYDAFETDDFALQSQLRKFDAPHRRIHSLAIDVEQLVEAGKREEALETIAAAWDDDLRSMIVLFDETYDLVCENMREILVVLAEEMNEPYCLIADGIREVRKSVEILDTNGMAIEGIPNTATSHDSSIVVGLSSTGEETAVLLDVTKLL